MPTKSKIIVCRGGVDIATAKSQVRPGTLSKCLNVDVGWRSGYARINGLERFDGQDTPTIDRWCIGTGVDPTYTPPDPTECQPGDTDCDYDPEDPPADDPPAGDDSPPSGFNPPGGYADDTIWWHDVSDNLTILTFDGTTLTKVSGPTAIGFAATTICSNGEYVFAVNTNGTQIKAFQYRSGSIATVATGTIASTSGNNNLCAKGSVAIDGSVTLIWSSNGGKLHMYSFNGSAFTAVDTDHNSGLAAGSQIAVTNSHVVINGELAGRSRFATVPWTTSGFGSGTVFEIRDHNFAADYRHMNWDGTYVYCAATNANPSFPAILIMSLSSSGVLAEVAAINEGGGSVDHAGIVKDGHYIDGVGGVRFGSFDGSSVSASLFSASLQPGLLPVGDRSDLSAVRYDQATAYVVNDSTSNLAAVDFDGATATTLDSIGLAADHKSLWAGKMTPVFASDETITWNGGSGTVVGTTFNPESGVTNIIYTPVSGAPPLAGQTVTGSASSLTIIEDARCHFEG